MDSVEAQGRVALGPSTVGGLTIDRAAVDGTYRDALGEIRQFELTGPDLGVQANGTIALNTSGQSNLAVRADTSSLEALTRLVNQKAKGIATIEATITGNRSDLRAAGRLTGNDLEFGGQSALQLASDFTARVPDLGLRARRRVVDDERDVCGRRRPGHQRADGEDRVPRSKHRLRSHGEAAEAVAERRRIAGAQHRSRTW